MPAFKFKQEIVLVLERAESPRLQSHLTNKPAFFSNQMLSIRRVVPGAGGGGDEDRTVNRRYRL